MIEQQIALSWAKALFQVAVTDEDKFRYLDNLNELKKAPELKQVITDPRIMIKEKEEMLTRIFQKAEDASFLRFLLLIAQKGRFTFIEEIHETYACLVRKHFGLREGTVYTSNGISPEKLAILKTKLDNVMSETIELATEEDKSLHGGATLTLGSHLFDGSVKGKLKRLKEQLMSVSITKE